MMPKIVDRIEWRASLDALLVEEKALTRARDALAAKRRRMPWLKVAKPYRFRAPEGDRRLQDLFDGRRQLIVYHHMLRPADPAPCVGCGMFGDQIPHLAHLHARDTTLAFVSRAPVAEIEAFRRRMGWSVPWWETTDEFGPDHDVDGGFGVNVFIRDGSDIYRSYSVSGRGAEVLGTVWSFLDLTPLGRQESWEDSPPGAPQTEPYQWWRLHDSYPAKAPPGD